MSPLIVPPPDSQRFAFRYRLVPLPGGFEYISTSVKSVTGYAAEEFYSDPDLDIKIVHPDDRERLYEMIADPSISDSLRWMRKDGRIIRLKLENTPIYSEEGQLVAIEGISYLEAGPYESDPAATRSSLGLGSGAAPAGQPLTRDELEVLSGSLAGRTDSEIAGAMQITVHAVGSHINNILRKLGAKNRSGAVAAAIRLGLVDQLGHEYKKDEEGHAGTD